MDYTLLTMLLKDLVILPLQEIKLELKDEISKNIIKISSKKYNDRVLIVSPLNYEEEEHSIADLPKVGVVAYIKNKIELNNGNIRVTLKGEKRVRVLSYESFSSEIIDAVVTDIELPKLDATKELVIRKKLKETIKKYIDSSPSISNSILKTISEKEDLNFITDVITTFIPITTLKKLNYMQEINSEKRAYSLINDLNLEMNYINLENKIDNNIDNKLRKEQEKFYLKEKLKEIEGMLGLNDTSKKDIKKLYEDAKKLKLEEKTYKKIENEIKKLEGISSSSPEEVIIRNYLDWIFNLPWHNASKENLNSKSVINSLNKSHYGLFKVKERIEDYVNLKNINNEISNPIICLVGPPGIGKTTISKSIASALSREFYKISVGGLNDSTELIGNRRTYLGALPGKIMQGLKRCGTNNPVILIDEVDKMVKDYKGDPASVLLDILDSNQNKYFIDNYIEEPFDLSNVLFILTANNKEDIPYTLYDRLEVIELSSYTSFEKKDIAKKYLISNIMEEFKLSKKITIKDETITYIIDNYTKEAGVRDLTRILKKLITKTITDKKTYSISIEDVIKYLGKGDYLEKREEVKISGVVNALAYTPYGGVVMPLECSIYSGEEDIITTGLPGNILKESVNVSVSYIKEKEYVSNTMFYNHVIHIHFLESAIKKEGPSCGVAITSAILSKLLDVVVSSEIAFTGEISLKGRILPVGGIKEKVISAFNNGIKKIYIPNDNQKDLFNIPDEIINNIEIKLVSDYENIYDDLFRKK